MGNDRQELQEAIKHIEDILSDDEKWVGCDLCRNEHIKLKSWLEELYDFKYGGNKNG